MTKIISWLMRSSLTRPAFLRFGGGYGIDGRMGLAPADSAGYFLRTTEEYFRTTGKNLKRRAL